MPVPKKPAGGRGKSGKLPSGGFADNAIGFYLEMQDNLTPTLAVASVSYRSFISQLDRLNRSAVQTASKGLEALAGAVESLGSLPARAVLAYKAAREGMQEDADANPITQPIKFKALPGEEKKTNQGMVEALTKALSKAQLRLSARLPEARSAYFDLGATLRTQYKKMVQPPDLVGGFFNLPKFAAGGPVGGKGPGDSVMAILHRGEEVLTKGARGTVAALLKGLAVAGKAVGKGGGAPSGAAPAPAKLTMKGVQAQLDAVEDLIASAEEWRNIANAGFDPKAVDNYNAAVQGVVKAMAAAKASSKEYYDGLNKGLQAIHGGTLAKRFAEVNGSMAAFGKGLQDVGGQAQRTAGFLERLLTRLIGPAGVALAIQSFKTIEGHVGRMRGEVAKVYNVDDVVGFAKQSRNLGNQLGMQRDAQLALRGSMVETADSMGGYAIGVNEVSAAYERVAGAGGRTAAEFKALVPVTAALASQDLDLTESLFALGKNMDPRQLAAYGAAMATAKQQTGLASGEFQSLSTTISEALAGAPTQVGKLTEALQFSTNNASALLEDFKKTRDVTPILNALVDSFAKVGSHTESAAALMKTLGMDIPLGSLQALAKRGDEVKASISGVAKSVSDAKDPIRALTDVVKPNVFWWERMGNYLGVALNKYFPGTVAFFEDINPSVLLATTNIALLTVSLARSLIPALWGAGVAIVSFIGRLFAVGAAATVAAATSTAAGTGMAAAGTGAAAGGAGFVAFFLAMNGLVAALPGIAIFLGIVLVLAVALRIITPLVQVLASAFVEFFKVFVGPVIAKVIDGIVAIAGNLTEAFKALSSMPASAILASAASLLVLGPAFAAIGAGLAMLGFGAGSAALGVGALMVVMRVLGGAKSFGESLTCLLGAFAVDPAVAMGALAGLQALTTFLGQFAVLSLAAMAATGLDVMRRAQGVFSFLVSGKSPLAMLADSGAALVATINNLSGSMSKVQTRNRDSVMAGMSYTGDLLAGLSNVLRSAQEVGTVAAGVRDSWWGLVSGPLSQLDKAARPLRETINRVSSEMAQIAPTADIASRMDSVSTFLRSTQSVLQAAGTLSQRGPQLRMEQTAVTDLRQSFSVAPITPEEIRQTVSMVSSQGEMLGLMREQLGVLHSIDDKVGPRAAPIAPTPPITPRQNRMVDNLTGGR